MLDHNGQLKAAVSVLGRRVWMDVPTRVFAAAAEQLRFDALRTGLLTADEWPNVEASVAPTCLDDAAPSESFAFVISLSGGEKPIRKVVDLQTLQRLRLHVNSRLSVLSAASERTDPRHAGDAIDRSASANLELHWPDLCQRMRVPLAPLVLPVSSSAPAGRMQQSQPLALRVTDEAHRQLLALAEESLHLGIELGGCLIGSLLNLDTVKIDRVGRASDTGGGVDEFSFDPSFWVGLTRDNQEERTRIMGWFHSHLIDHGHPATLSTRDLHTSHLYFSTPWQVTALVCAFQRKSEIRWFRWQDGALSECDPSAAQERA